MNYRILLYVDWAGFAQLAFISSLVILSSRQVRDMIGTEEILDGKFVDKETFKILLERFDAAYPQDDFRTIKS